MAFSFIGYVTQEVEVGNRSTINVTLVGDDKALNEVVVGYGTQSRRELTGSIASLSTQTIRDQPVTNVVEGLTGRLPGVLIQQNTGAPGNAPSIKVRGLGSISAGNGPLVVVDGQPLNSGGLTNAGGLQQLNPNDIDKTDILKDASATAIFGSRGANGVVLVTTKRGRSGQPRISVDYYTGVQEVSKTMDLLNSRQLAEYSKQAYNTAYLERVPGALASDPNSKRQAEQRYVTLGANFRASTSTIRLRCKTSTIRHLFFRRHRSAITRYRRRAVLIKCSISCRVTTSRMTVSSSSRVWTAIPSGRTSTPN